MMVLIKTAPYGEWESPITVEAAMAPPHVLTSEVCESPDSEFFPDFRPDGSNSFADDTYENPKHAIMTSPTAIYHNEIPTDTSLAQPTLPYHPEDNEGIPESYISPAQPLTFTTLREPRRDISGWFFPPQNPRFVGPAGEAPPLVVGLPWEEEDGVDMAVQFLTSRGYAYFALDSEGEGMVEEDVAEVAEYLGWSGRVDGGRIGVVGEDGIVEVFREEEGMGELGWGWEWGLKSEGEGAAERLD